MITVFKYELEKRTPTDASNAPRQQIARLTRENQLLKLLLYGPPKSVSALPAKDALRRFEAARAAAR